jgi:hypothetical protein
MQRTAALESPPSIASPRQPMLMSLSTSASTSSIEASPPKPSSRRLFHDTPTAPTAPSPYTLVSPIATSSHTEAHTPTAAASQGQDVFGKIDHTPLRQETHSTSPLPNSRSFQTGDMLDHVLDPAHFSRLSVGNIIAPERASSKKPPRRLPTDTDSTTASPTPRSRSSAKPRTALTSIAPHNNTTDSTTFAPPKPASTSSPASSDPFSRPHRSSPSAHDLSLHVKHHMAALQHSPQSH